jgi:hypothetical protein
MTRRLRVFALGYSYAIQPANLVVSLGFAVLIASTARCWLIPILAKCCWAFCRCSL